MFVLHSAEGVAILDVSCKIAPEKYMWYDNTVCRRVPAYLLTRETVWVSSYCSALSSGSVLRYRPKILLSQRNGGYP